jgi:hypothetical protein
LTIENYKYEYIGYKNKDIQKDNIVFACEYNKKRISEIMTFIYIFSKHHKVIKFDAALNEYFFLGPKYSTLLNHHTIVYNYVQNSFDLLHTALFKMYYRKVDVNETSKV